MTGARGPALTAGRRGEATPHGGELELLLSYRRALRAVIGGIVVGGLVAVAGEPELAPVAAWLAAVGIALAWVWRLLWRLDADATKHLAEYEGQTRTTDTAVLAAAVMSLGLVALALVRAGGQQGAAATATVILCVVAVVLSWALVNTVFALKYARHYYIDEDGGIDFKQAEPPAYSDFAYLAFSIGMAFQVAETEPVTTAIRKVALGHALLSYVFSAGVLAVAVNLVTNLSQS
jgi:uncharacterized membrane protein